MSAYYAYLAAGLLGILGHWYTRWIQGRTANTFIEYLKDNSKYTIAAVISIIGSSSAIFSVSPDLTIQLVFSSYFAGYTLDSTINRDSTTPTTNKPEVKNEKKSIHDIIIDDQSS